MQGLVTLNDVNGRTGGFCVIPGSHMHHEELLTVAANRSKNYVSVPPDSPLLKHRQVMPVCQAGDLLLWDSRTSHCNSPAMETPTASPDQLLRMVGYVCMTPRSLADERTIAARVKIYERGMSTSHWPHLFPFDVDDSSPRERNIEDAPLEQRALVGVI